MNQKLGFKIFMPVLLLLVTLYSNKAEGQISLSLPTRLACSPDTLIVPVNTTNFWDVTKFSLIFTYDPTLLTFDSIELQNRIFRAQPVTSVASTGQVTLNWDYPGTSLKFGDGWLVYLHFTLKQPGIAALNWDAAQTSIMKSGIGETLSLNDGSVTISTKNIKYTLEQLVAGCLGDDKGRYAAHITAGNPPYSINWNGGFMNPGTDTVVFGLREGEHKVSILDAKGCRYNDTYFVRITPAPHVEASMDEDFDTVYVENPKIQFLSNISELIADGEPIASWQWNFGEPDSSKSIEMSPAHIFTSANEKFEAGQGDYQVKLWTISNNGCDTTILLSVPIKKPEVTVPTVITPNGDGYNDILVITVDNKSAVSQPKLLRYYERMELAIYNRHGRKVFESNDYQNDWDGAGVSDGTYFFALRCFGRFHEEKFKGSILVIRGSN